MMFISMVFATIMLVVFAIGFVFLALGIFLTISWKHKTKSGKNVNAAQKTFAVISTIIGIVVFVIPFSILVIYDASHKFESFSKRASFGKSVEIGSDTLDNGFTIDGIKYVLVEELNCPNKDTLEKKCALVYDNGTYAGCYYVKNEINMDILGAGSNIFVPEDQADYIRDYYLNKAVLSVTISYQKDGNKKSHEIENFDRDIICGIKDLHSEVYNLKYKTSDIDESIGTKHIWISSISSDHVYEIDEWIYYVNGEFVLDRVEGGEDHSGIALKPEQQEYLIKILKDNTDLNIK